MTTPTKGAADRVRRYRDEYANHPWTIHDGKEAYTAAVGVCTENALDALTTDPVESQVWVELASVLSFKYRRVF